MVVLKEIENQKMFWGKAIVLFKPNDLIIIAEHFFVEHFHVKLNLILAQGLRKDKIKYYQLATTWSNAAAV